MIPPRLSLVEKQASTWLSLYPQVWHDQIETDSERMLLAEVDEVAGHPNCNMGPFLPNWENRLLDL